MLNFFDKNKKLISAAKNGKLRKVKKLLQSSGEFPIDCLNESLLQASLYDCPEIIEELIKAGADVNVKIGNRGWTPLFYAVENGRVQAVKCLLKNGADINARDKKSITPLMQSVDLELDSINQSRINKNDITDDCFEVSLLLIKAGADVDAFDEDGESVLDIAHLYNNSYAIKFLQEHGAIDTSEWKLQKIHNGKNQETEKKGSIHEIIEKLRQLNRPVPIPIRLPTVKEISKMEQELEVRFHPDYREYLLKASDVVYPTLEPATITNPKSHTYLPKVYQRARDWGVPQDLLPICEDNANFYCMNKEGQVLYWAHDGWTDEKWDNLATWIQDVWIDGN